jgi:hypothetical protein
VSATCVVAEDPLSRAGDVKVCVSLHSDQHDVPELRAGYPNLVGFCDTGPLATPENDLWCESFLRGMLNKVVRLWLCNSPDALTSLNVLLCSHAAPPARPPPPPHGAPPP